MRLEKFVLSMFQSVVFWTLAFFIFVFVKYHGLEHELKVYTDDVLYLPVTEFYQYGLFLGLIIGFFYGIIEFLFDSFLSKRLILGLSLILRSAIYFVIIIVLLSIFSILIEEHLDLDLPNERGWWYKDPFFWNTVLYFVISSAMFSLLKIANDKFGPGVFLNMLLGKYRKPREEERILMFLDLKDSTRIAEELGHELYSQFIQDCFIDLNSVFRKYEADIYQYVGDEAVLVWKNKTGFRKNNCVNLFYAFKDRLNRRQQYYLKKYNKLPEFKAGLHCGKLMIAEVGTVKKELAYHGDVINTASRIQGLCNSYNAELLVSQSLLEKSIVKLKFEASLLGDITLKGKENKLKVYEINKKDSV